MTSSPQFPSWRRSLRGLAVALCLATSFPTRAADPVPQPTPEDPAFAATAALRALESLDAGTARAPVTAPPVQASASSQAVPEPPAPNNTTNAAPPETQSPAASSATAESAPLPAAMSGLDNKHKLAIGDRLSLRIVEDEDDPRPLVVTDAGDIEAPYVGRIPAAGRTCRELASNLKAELEKEYYYQATVILAVDLMARSRGKVYLVGPVRVPGALEIPSDETLTLSKAILRAGGFLDIADKKNVRITRRGSGGDGDSQFTVNVADILEKGRSEGDQVLQPGDLIFVPERLIRF